MNGSVFSFLAEDGFFLTNDGKRFYRSIAVGPGIELTTSGRVAGKVYGRLLEGEGLKCMDLAAEDCRISASLNGREASDSVQVILQQDGKGSIRVPGESMNLRRGDWAVLMADVRYESEAQAMSRLVIVRVQAPNMDGFREKRGSALLWSQTADGGVFVRDFLQNLIVQTERTVTENGVELARALQMLLQMEFSRSGHRETNKQTSNDLKSRIKIYIASNLREAELSLDRLSEAMRCSKRSLHKAFSDEGISVSDYLWRVRLEECRRQLENAEARERSITEIAFSCGFSSPSHFSTLFKTHFQISPREFRNRAIRSEHAARPAAYFYQTGEPALSVAE